MLLIVNIIKSMNNLAAPYTIFYKIFFNICSMCNNLNKLFPFCVKIFALQESVFCLILLERKNPNLSTPTFLPNLLYQHSPSVPVCDAWVGAAPAALSRQGRWASSQPGPVRAPGASSSHRRCRSSGAALPPRPHSTISVPPAPRSGPKVTCTTIWLVKSERFCS